jgi:hypothetical protein
MTPAFRLVGVPIPFAVVFFHDIFPLFRIPRVLVSNIVVEVQVWDLIKNGRSYFTNVVVVAI